MQVHVFEIDWFERNNPFFRIYHCIPKKMLKIILQKFMPDGIYLHAGKIEVSDLAKQMNDIIKNKDRYYSFFKWRNHYSYHDKEESPDSDDQCITCAMLNDDALMKKETVYKDFTNWWNVPWECYGRKG
ncbi:uncharacterized protein LOC134669771 isoform X2 [Cydia fagiglandana]|uniref:uncharacterized protein LOC134669771 isoform X2 n=1 Tax=Cydia fagiglandana TaxID=1458189 RepID=UPI002FEE119E